MIPKLKFKIAISNFATNYEVTNDIMTWLKDNGLKPMLYKEHTARIIFNIDDVRYDKLVKYINSLKNKHISLIDLSAQPKDTQTENKIRKMIDEQIDIMLKK
ncbi:hypothetical protein MEO93_20900 [Dolichospermum sp. ST_sed3]|nr:hypothetical protein [Dolichospermum sp. ST_sed3]